MSESMECLCYLMRTVGPKLDIPKAKVYLDIICSFFYLDLFIVHFCWSAAVRGGHAHQAFKTGFHGDFTFFVPAVYRCAVLQFCCLALLDKDVPSKIFSLVIVYGSFKLS